MCLTTNLFSTDVLKDYNLYFFGIVKHFEPTPNTHEGNMDYFAISKTYSYKAYRFETGLGTFIDSYSIRAYRLFVNISHMEYKWGVITPMLGLDCYSKGKEYTSNKRQNICSPSVKLRVGEENGLFVNIMPVPKIKGLTNGFISIEFGYKL